MVEKGIYRLRGVYGTLTTIQNIETFIATLADGSLLIVEVDPLDRPQLAGKSWTEVVEPPQKDRFTYAAWTSWVNGAATDIYQDLLDEYEDEIEVEDLYAEEDERVLPWNAKVRLSAQRVTITYLLESEWGKSIRGQEQAIAFSGVKPTHEQLAYFHKLLYQTTVMSHYSHTRRAQFLACCVSMLMTAILKQRKQHDAEIRTTSATTRRSTYGRVDSY